MGEAKKTKEGQKSELEDKESNSWSPPSRSPAPLQPQKK